MQHSKNIIFFMLSVIGGAEKMTIQIAKILIDRGWKVHFVIINKHNESDQRRALNILPPNNEVTIINPQNQIHFLLELGRIVYNSRSSMCFCSAMHINIRILLIGLFSVKKIIVRNENYISTLTPLKRVLLALSYRRANLIIAQTEEMRSELIKLCLPQDKVKVLYNYVNVDRITRLSQKYNPFSLEDDMSRIHPYRFVSVGRICPQKGFDVLIKAFQLVLNNFRNSELHIVGDINYEGGRYYKELLTLVEESGIKEHVFFHGYKENPYPYIEKCDTYVLSSRNEGLPNVLIEAIVFGKKCVATKCIPIIERMLTDEITGFLAESDNPLSLSEAMLKSITSNISPATFRTSTVQDYAQIFETIV